MPSHSILLSQDRLKELLSYDPETGIFRWKAKSSPNAQRVNIGSIAGHLEHIGYISIQVNGKAYKAHRLAWLYVYGQWPVDEVDHRNGIKDDNRLANLRECTHAQNHQNRKLRRDSNNSYLGVGWHGHSQRWIARIQKDGKRIHLGYFSTKEAAHAAYCEAKRRIHAFNPELRDNSAVHA